MLSNVAAPTPHPVLLVTGLASPGKTRLIDALAQRLDARAIEIRTSRDAGQVVLHVHAESDLESMVEGGWLPRDAARGAQLVIAVDWESLDRSVQRVLDALNGPAHAAWKGAA